MYLVQFLMEDENWECSIYFIENEKLLISQEHPVSDPTIPLINFYLELGCRVEIEDLEEGEFGEISHENFSLIKREEMS